MVYTQTNADFASKHYVSQQGAFRFSHDWSPLSFYFVNHAKNFDTIDDATTIIKLKTSHDFTESIMNNLPHRLMYEEHHYRKSLSDLPAAELKMTNSSCLRFIVDPLAYTERRNLNKRTYHSNILCHFENPHYNRLRPVWHRNDHDTFIL